MWVLVPGPRPQGLWGRVRGALRRAWCWRMWAARESGLGSPFADLVWILLLAALGPRRPGIAREPGVGGWGWLGEAGGTLDPVPAWVLGCGARVTTAPRRPYAALQPGEGAARTVLLQRPALAVLRGTVAAAGPNVVSG